MCIETRCLEMNEDIKEIQTLLKEVVDHLTQSHLSVRPRAMQKLMRIASLATTMALTLQAGRCK